jgi:hypothetical protein
MSNTISLDKVLVPGQTVRVVRTVEIAIDVDIRAYLEDSGDEDITVEQLQSDIENNFDIDDMRDEWSDSEVVDIAVTVTSIS